MMQVNSFLQKILSDEFHLSVHGKPTGLPLLTGLTAEHPLARVF